MLRVRNLIPLILLRFGILDAFGSNYTLSFCKSLSPWRSFNPLNETLRECYFPLETAIDDPSCEIGNDDSNAYPRCVDHAKCVQNPHSRGKSSFGTCVCKHGFKMTSYFTCDRNRGVNERCQFWNVRGPTGLNVQTDDCDTSLGLICASGFCQCKTQNEDGVCILLQNQPCRLDEKGLNGTALCAQNSHCAKHYNERDLGICTCDRGYQSGRDRECQKILGFGEHCEASTGQRCDENAGHSCNLGVCSCDLPSQDSEGICLIRVGGSCKSGPNELNCLENATCSDGICKCNNGFLQVNSGADCKLLMQHGENCNDDGTLANCDTASGLMCVEGKCECMGWLSLDKKSCVLQPDDVCYLENPTAFCISNSICKRQKYLDPNSNMGTCDCVDAFVLSKIDRSCNQILGKGEKCKPETYRHEDFCNRKLGLSCSTPSYACACTNGETDDGQCKLKVGDSCATPDKNYPNCPLNSKCGGTGKFSSCRCEPGLIPTSDKSRCLPQVAHLETCGETEGICPKDLLCIRGRCQCSDPDNFVFDPEVKGCRSKGVCKRDSECQTKSTCEPLHSGSSTKRCKCKEGYSLDHQSLCKSNYMTSCSLSIDCLTAKSMGWIDGVCRCIAPWNQIYNSKIEECVGLVGCPCGTRNKKCMENAFCDMDGICRCASGSITSDDGKCAQFLDFGANCTQEGGRYCNWAKGLACVDGVCACVDPYLEYLADLGTCVGKLGSICGLKIPVGKCEEEKTKIFRFSPCNYYDIHCGEQTNCKKTDIGDINRCLA